MRIMPTYTCEMRVASVVYFIWLPALNLKGGHRSLKKVTLNLYRKTPPHTTTL